MLPPKKKCGGSCGLERPTDEFSPRIAGTTPSKLSDLNSDCKTCHRAAARLSARRKRAKRLDDDQLMEELSKAQEWLDELAAEQLRRGGFQVEVKHGAVAGARVTPVGILPQPG